MKIFSLAFEHMGSIPEKYTCDGEGINPPLVFEDVLDQAHALVLIMEDPDVPKTVRADGMWDHWIVWNIDPRMKDIDEGSEIPGVHGRTTSGTLTYVPPCPPDREHRYHFTLYAVDAVMDVPEGASKHEILVSMEGHIIDKKTLTGVYCKKENRST